MIHQVVRRFYSNQKTYDRPRFLIRQLFEQRSFTYTYLLADTHSREAVIIDPVLEMVDRDLRIVKDLGLTLKYAVNTHVHADHITGSGRIKKLLTSCRSVISSSSEAVADVHLKDGDTLKFGDHELVSRNTPGHTDGCMSFILHNQHYVFTGDAVLIRGCGRTDFQQGSSEKLYKSVHEKIFTLPDHYYICPGHDYIGQTISTVGEEKMLNPRLSKNINEFLLTMSLLKLPYPKQIDRALPLNMVCGLQDLVIADKDGNV